MGEASRTMAGESAQPSLLLGIGFGLLSSLGPLAIDLYLLAMPGMAREMAAEHDYADHLAARYGYEQIENLDAAGFAALCPSPAYHGGTLDMGAAHLHPLGLALGLARAALRPRTGRIVILTVAPVAVILLLLALLNLISLFRQ